MRTGKCFDPDELLQATLPMWPTTFGKFDLKNPHHKIRAYISCILPPSKARNKGQSRKSDAKLRNDVIGDILNKFLVEARPILELYGKGQNPGTSTDDIEEMMGEMQQGISGP